MMFTVKRTATATTVAGAALALTLLPAVAQADDTFTMGGTVTGTGGVNVRTTPSTEGTAASTLNRGAEFQTTCKTTGEPVGDTDVWYALPSSSEQPLYVSGAFVQVPDDFELPNC
ncbi:MAG: hypothetical protein L0G99_00975 [Propionibacteriales bacterium]|nr:hypothetical protein [Propionibacteriales bacterium]